MNEKQTATRNDNRLMEAAHYCETKGFTVVLNDPGRIFERFAEYKRLVRRGSVTIERIESDVYEKYGITSGDHGNAFDQLMEALPYIHNVLKKGQQNEDNKDNKEKDKRPSQSD